MFNQSLPNTSRDLRVLIFRLRPTRFEATAKF